MEFYLFLLVFTFVWKSTLSLQCYRCIPERTSEEPDGPLCEDFDGGDRFIVDCPNSTMCHKKETLLESLGATTKYVERRCALQTRGPEQVKRNGKWVYEVTIHEPYEESCKEDSMELGRSTQTTNCYCRGDFCNNASNIGSRWPVVLGVIWMARSFI